MQSSRLMLDYSVDSTFPTALGPVGGKREEEKGMEPEKAFVAETTGCLRLETGGPDYQRRAFTFRDRDAIGGGKVVHPGQMGAVLQICIKQKPIFIRIFFNQ